MLSVLCVALLAAGAAASGCDDPARPLVATREGLVRGTAGRSAAGRPFSAFRGVPYGTAARFEPPRRRAAWQGVRDAADHGANCLQFDLLGTMALKGDEDCLFANVYTPLLPPADGAPAGRLPVMVFIHGGGFIMGSGDDDMYGPAYLMDEDVVLVTFNYRLGVMGLFNTNSAEAPGNYGLLDQVLLLQWVRDNIAAFGGDPGAVTVFGQSAGSSCVSMLVLSPLAKGLFHHAISQSGASLAGFVPDRDQRPNTERFAGLFNCSGSAAELVSCIKQLPASTVLEATQPFMMEDTFFMPREDRESPAPFMPESPRTLLERGHFNLVPWMNGVTEEEGAMYVAMLAGDPDQVAGLAAGSPAAWTKLTRLSSTLWDDMLECGADMDHEAAKVRDFYGPVSADSLVVAGRAQADRIFVAAHAEEVRLAARHAPVYQYLLDHRGPGRLTVAGLFGLAPEEAMQFGPTHGDDLCYLFSTQLAPLAAPDSPEYAMIRYMTGLWASFARIGRPAAAQFSSPDWPVYTEAGQRYMRLNSEPSLGERLFEDRAAFWQTVRLREAWRKPALHSGAGDAQSCPRPDRG